ncbi:MAG: hypothetical protein IJ459_02050 [Clostridia bacterium]|nr:hypothetical protein [Clostridia bacterium]
MRKTKLRIGSNTYDMTDKKLRDYVGYVGPSDTAGVPSLAYELSADGNYYIVTGRGTVKGSEIIIPDTYEGKPVLEVAENAFKDDTEITKLTLGKYIIFVGVGNIETLANLTELYCRANLDDDFAETISAATGKTYNELSFGGSDTVVYCFVEEHLYVHLIGNVEAEIDENDEEWINHTFIPGNLTHSNIIEQYREQYALALEAGHDAELMMKSAA